MPRHEELEKECCGENEKKKGDALPWQRSVHETANLWDSDEPVCTTAAHEREARSKVSGLNTKGESASYYFEVMSAVRGARVARRAKEIAKLFRIERTSDQSASLLSILERVIVLSRLISELLSRIADSRSYRVTIGRNKSALSPKRYIDV